MTPERWEQVNRVVSFRIAVRPQAQRAASYQSSRAMAIRSCGKKLVTGESHEDSG
jgi:hypothetical protein